MFYHFIDKSTGPKKEWVVHVYLLAVQLSFEGIVSETFHHKSNSMLKFNILDLYHLQNSMVNTVSHLPNRHSHCFILSLQQECRFKRYFCPATCMLESGLLPSPIGEFSTKWLFYMYVYNPFLANGIWGVLKHSEKSFPKHLKKQQCFSVLEVIVQNIILRITAANLWPGRENFPVF